MIYEIPSIQALVDQALDLYEQSRFGHVTDGTGTIFDPSVETAMSCVDAGLAYGLYAKIQEVARDIIPGPQNSEAGVLAWASVFLPPDEQRKQPTAAQLTLSGDAPAEFVIPTGTTWETQDGRSYATTSDTVYGLEPLLATSTALEGEPGYGSGGNVTAGEELTLSSGPVELGDTWVAQGPAGALVGAGSDLETLQSLSARTLERMANPPIGRLIDYRLWARAVPGVGKAWAFRDISGAGTIGVSVLRDVEDGALPGAALPDLALLIRVIDFLRLKAPAQAGTVRVFGPVPNPIDIEVAINPYNPEVEISVIAALNEQIGRLASPGQTDNNGVFDLSWLGEAVSLAPGEVGHTIVTPSSDIAVAPVEIITVNTITITEK